MATSLKVVRSLTYNEIKDLKEREKRKQGRKGKAWSVCIWVWVYVCMCECVVGVYVCVWMCLLFVCSLWQCVSVMYVCAWACLLLCTYVHVSMHVCECVYVRVCVCVCGIPSSFCANAASWWRPALLKAHEFWKKRSAFPESSTGQNAPRVSPVLSPSSQAPR